MIGAELQIFGSLEILSLAFLLNTGIVESDSVPPFQPVVNAAPFDIGRPSIELRQLVSYTEACPAIF